MVAQSVDREIALVPGSMECHRGVRPYASGGRHADLRIEPDFVVVEIPRLEALREPELGLHPAEARVDTNSENPAVVVLREDLDTRSPARRALVGPAGDLGQHVLQVQHLPEVERQADVPVTAWRRATSHSRLRDGACPHVDRYRPVAPDDRAGPAAAAALACLRTLFGALPFFAGRYQDDLHPAVLAG